ncbi:hypothetical protein R8Z57_07410 [Microbacterium sp. M3]|uniref:Uncharacterized protein n=1 Tax=Microbacterium arthrosphaerae TaxID=792652 RepID=A0ABU4GZU5_9MICO|nr:MULTISPECIES: hypothetical protein [Microbacterium]MDW4572603.1 hypothetical protein [Microbacterium arthrosphaerae]MDW7606458.1 hypothetical protein [Microbacterium sp. M3]
MTMLVMTGCAGASTATSDEEAPATVETPTVEESAPAEPAEPAPVASACEEDWLRQLSMDGTFEVTARGDLEGATSLPAVAEGGEVQFPTPAICVVDVDLLDVGISRSYIFAGGLPFDLADSFTAAGWDGSFGYAGGYADGAFSPTVEIDLSYAQLSDSFHAAGEGTGLMPRDHYRMNLTPTLVEQLGG